MPTCCDCASTFEETSVHFDYSLYDRRHRCVPCLRQEDILNRIKGIEKDVVELRRAAALLIVKP